MRAKGLHRLATAIALPCNSHCNSHCIVSLPAPYLLITHGHKHIHGRKGKKPRTGQGLLTST